MEMNISPLFPYTCSRVLTDYYIVKHYCIVKQCVPTSYPPFLFLFRKNCSHVLPLCILVAIFFSQLLHDNFLQSFFLQLGMRTDFAAYKSCNRQPTVTDHKEISDAGAQQGPVQESGPERVW